jgi:hypothetical protein
MVSQTIEQSAGQALGTESFGSLGKRKIAGHQRGSAFVALAETSNSNSARVLDKRHKAELIDD